MTILSSKRLALKHNSFTFSQLEQTPSYVLHISSRTPPSLPLIQSLDKSCQKNMLIILNDLFAENLHHLLCQTRI